MLTGQSDVLCGGKVVVFGGDMGQVLPVVDGVPVSANDQYAITAWKHWNSTRLLTLTRNMRAIEDPDFAKWLQTVRDGSANVNNSDDIILPDDIVLNHKEKSQVTEDSLMDALVQNVSLYSPTGKFKYFKKARQCIN